MEYVFTILIIFISFIVTKCEAVFHTSEISPNTSITAKVAKMASSDEIYYLLQEALPELKKQEIPQNSQEFTNFRDWLNEHHSYMQYVEIKEFYDNGISDSEILKDAQIDTTALEKKIEQDVQQVWKEYGDKYTEEDFEKLSIDEQFDIKIELDYEVEKALFSNIKKVAEEKNLKLFVVVRENPYWFVLPNDPDKNKKIVDAFNQVFADGGDTKLLLY